MKTLRCIALLVCLAAPLGLGAGAAHAAQAQATGNSQGVAEGVPAWTQTLSKPALQPAVKPATQAKPKIKAKPVAKASTKKAAKPVSKVAAQPIQPVRLDLSLPKEMVKDLKPQVDPPVRTSLLPAMFGDSVGSDSGFQLNGRLISNEMQLQLRNDSRRDLEGAAIDFQFRQ